MRACALGVGFGPFHFSEAPRVGSAKFAAVPGCFVLRRAGENCEDPAALDLQRAVVLVRREGDAA